MKDEGLLVSFSLRKVQMLLYTHRFVLMVDDSSVYTNRNTCLPGEVIANRSNSATTVWMFCYTWKQSLYVGWCFIGLTFFWVFADIRIKDQSKLTRQVQYKYTLYELLILKIGNELLGTLFQMCNIMVTN